MVHDPCNPVPSSTIPKGLPLRQQHATKHVVGGAKPGPVLQSHAVTAIAPIHVGCDHVHPASDPSLRMNAVHFPAAIDVPATILLPSANVTVATLSTIPPLVINDGEPNTGMLVPMPDPSGAALFLFAVFIAWTARRFNTRRLNGPFFGGDFLDPLPVARLRHRSRSIAPFCALQSQMR